MHGALELAVFVHDSDLSLRCCNVRVCVFCHSKVLFLRTRDVDRRNARLAIEFEFGGRFTHGSIRHRCRQRRRRRREATQRPHHAIALGYN